MSGVPAEVQRPGRGAEAAAHQVVSRRLALGESIKIYLTTLCCQLAAGTWGEL